MGVSVNDRVRKCRAKKTSTQKGQEEMKAINRVYADRCRRKKAIKSLLEEKASLIKALDPNQQHDVQIKAREFKARLLHKKKDNELDGDKKAKIDLKVLKYETKVMKRLLKEKLTPVSSSSGNEVDGIIDGATKDLVPTALPVFESWYDESVLQLSSLFGFFETEG